MSAKFDTIGEQLTQSNNVASNSDYTALFWIKFNSVPTSDLTICTRKSTDGTQYSGLYYSVNNESFGLKVSGYAYPDAVGIWIYDILGLWKLVSLTYNTTSLRTTLDITDDYVAFIPYPIDTFTFDDLVIAPGDANVEIAYFREWGALLALATPPSGGGGATSVELLEEVQYPNAVRTADLTVDTPLIDDILDDSGNGNHWTATGTISFTTSPPLAVAPPNYTEALATVIPSFPYYLVQSDISSLELTYDVWYKYTAVAGDIMVGENFNSNPGYNPNVSVFIDDSSKRLKQYGPGRMNQTPFLVGRTYYWKFHSNNHWPTAELIVDMLPAPTDTLLATGSIFIRTAVMQSTDWVTWGYPGTYAGFINPNTGEIYHFITDMPPGDSGDTLPDGIMLFADDWEVGGIPGRFILYQPGFVTPVELVWIWHGDDPGWPYIRASRETNKFYIGSRGDGSHDPKYTTIDADGTIGADVTFTGTYLEAIANSHDDLYVYVAGSLPGIIKKWNKGTAAFEASNFADGVEIDTIPYSIRDMLVMKNGEVVVMYQKFGFPTAFFIRVYDTAGVVLRTYTGPSPEKYPLVYPRLGYANDDSLSFWVFIHERLSGYEFSRFLRLQLSDLAILTEITAPDVYYMLIPRGDDPPYRFVTSDCCPIVMAYPADKSGIYYKHPRPSVPPSTPPPGRRDKYYTAEEKIPNPTIRTALLGE